MHSKTIVACVACCFFISGVFRSVVAELPPKTLAEISALNERVSDAGRLFLQKKYLDSGEVIKQIQAAMEKMAMGGAPDVIEALKPIYERLAKAHALLELEGVALPPLKPLDAEPEIPEGERVSFVAQVAPILVQKCGRCHIAITRGHFSTVNFAALMKGIPDGAVVVARDDDSKLLQVIRKGEMPKGGLMITSEEFKTLKVWIQQGAAFDGDSQQTELAKLKPSGGDGQTPNPQ